MRENEVEKQFVEAVRAAGGQALKFTSQSMNGVPDRLVLLLGGKCAFVELKAPGKQMRIVKTPSGYWQQVPQVSIAQTYLKIMNKFAEQFGLTPSSRSRIIASDGGPVDAADEMENLLGGGGS